MSIPKWRGAGPFGLATRVHNAKEDLGWLWPGPTSGMRTDYTCHGRPVIFLHNPKTGGNSLGKLLGVKRLSHTFASKRLNEKQWLSCFSVVAVRDPFERFLSGYYSHIMRPDKNGLVKIYGWNIKKITPRDYLDVLARNPKFGGRQTLWTDFPSGKKPRADLVLKLEEVATWHAQLIAAGVDVSGRTLDHANKSARANSDHLSRLDMTATEFAELERDVRAYFAVDYIAFGYA